MEFPPAVTWVLCAAAASLAIWVLYRLTRKPFSPVQWLLYYFNQLVVRRLWRGQLPNSLPLPRQAGAVIICNHRSSIDPCIVQAAAGPRLVHWMVAQLYQRRSAIGWLMKLCEIIPVRRHGNDVSPAKAAIELAKAGAVVGILPEGTINTTEQFMLPARPGAVLVALKAQVPIVPCYIEGAPYHDVAWRPALMRARVRLTVGSPLDLSEFYGREREEGVLAQLTLRCVDEIAKLAERDDFEPQLAGRGWKTWQ